jgi:hypothetical protein
VEDRWLFDLLVVVLTLRFLICEPRILTVN